MYTYVYEFYVKIFFFQIIVKLINNYFSDFNHNYIYKSRTFKCNYCNFRSKMEILLESHIFNKHKRSEFVKEGYLNASKCHRCFKVYNHYRNLIRHLTTECGLQPKFQCPFCPFKCKQKPNVQSHIKRVHKILE